MLSIIIVNKNRNQELKRMLQSLRQTDPSDRYKDKYEIIVVDTDSDSYDPEIYNDPNLKIVTVRPNHEPFCLSWARNVGARFAQYSWLLFMDADLVFCQSPPFLPELIMQVKRAKPNEIYSGYRYDLNANGHNRDPAPKTFWGSFHLVHRAAFNKVNGYNESFVGHGDEDQDFVTRIKDAGVKPVVAERLIMKHPHHESGAITWAQPRDLNPLILPKGEYRMPQEPGVFDPDKTRKDIQDFLNKHIVELRTKTDKALLETEALRKRVRELQAIETELRRKITNIEKEKSVAWSAGYETRKRETPEVPKTVSVAEATPEPPPRPEGRVIIEGVNDIIDPDKSKPWWKRFSIFR